MPTSVLLIETDIEGSSNLACSLQMLGSDWYVEYATSFLQASRLLAVGAFDVVICDHWLQDGSAFDVLKKSGSMPVVIALKAGDEASAAGALRCGFADFLIKDSNGDCTVALPGQLRDAVQWAEKKRESLAAKATGAQLLSFLQQANGAQASYIGGDSLATIFDRLLHQLLLETNSNYGFLVEPQHLARHPDSHPALLAVAALDADGNRTSLRNRSDDLAYVAGHLAGLVTTAVEVGRAMCVDPVALDAVARQQLASHPQLESLATWPVPLRGSTVAVLALANRTGGYGETELSALGPAICVISQLLDGEKCRQAAQKREADLQRQNLELHQRLDALNSALDGISVGVEAVDSTGRVHIYNRKYCEMLDLPSSFMATQPHWEDVVRKQLQHGDSSENLLIDLSTVGDMVVPDIYVRPKRGGKTLEVKTQPLGQGGRVRTFIDVSGYMLAQEAVRQSDARWRNLTELAADWYWEQDANFRFVRVDGKGFERPEISEDSSLGLTRWELPSTSVTELQWQEHRSLLEAHGAFRNFEMQRIGTNGATYWVSISGKPLFDANGQFCGYSGVGRDISSRKNAEAQIERLAFYDDLTKLPNRRLLLDRLGRAIVSNARKRRHGALLFLDLDNFKDLNDTLGHEWGDRLLEQVAVRITACVRAGDTVARLGGDEFVVVLEELHEVGPEAAAEAEAVGQKILASLNKPYMVAGSEIHSTPSIGITLFNERQQTVEDLLKRADLAMYQAKAGGRNTLCFFDPDMQAAVTARSALESDLRYGLQRDEFVVYYQPVVNAAGDLLGVEALVRWNHPQRGMVSPAHFITLAEQTGLILDLGRKVLQVACVQLVLWGKHAETDQLTIAVNVSARQFRHPDFVQHVLQVIEITGVNPYRLKLELTESLLLNDVEDIIAKMNALRTLGIGFSLDDFGTGYSSLSYLKRLPLDQLKIDQSFVRDVLTDPNDAAIACTIVALAHSLGLAVVAEGVETAGQLEFLMRNGCQCFQGYFFGRPAPIDVLQMIATAGNVHARTLQI